MNILIVEDEPISQKLMSRQLETYGSITLVDTGSKAIEAIRQSLHEQRLFDVVFLDIKIPEPDGQEVLKQIATMEEEHHIPAESRTKVIMTSSLDDPMNVVTAFQHGCAGYLTKPLKRDYLEAEMRKLGLL